ncbi:MAG TPA: sulfotransferase [Abditibacteriaceae bacterium]|nr:sulfotransferase [Abditibacteriaceae bacterium]
MAIRVIGAGLARTGTMSMKAALEELGFKDCYHMIDLLGHPEQVHYWEAASRGDEVDWDGVFTGYQATVDYPGCRYYRQLMEKYPGAKVILTIRDPEKWYESTRETIYQVMLRVFGEDGQSRTAPNFPGDPALLLRVMELIRRDMWDGDFQGRFNDREFVIDFFNRYIAQVREHVPADRLLVFEVQEGWEPLCRFLGVPVPQDKPFPRLNDRETFMKRLQSGTLEK